MRGFLICLISVYLLSLAGCKEDSVSELSKPAREGDGRVTCYNPDGSVFFDEVGSYVDIWDDGIIHFRYMEDHPKYNKGKLKFTPAWRCLVDDWK